MERIQQSIQVGLLRPLRKFGLTVARRWPWPVSVRIGDGKAMYVDLRSSIGRALFMKGEFDAAVFEPLKSALQNGGTFIDVGANVGYYSLCALDLVGRSGNVHAFEIDERPLRCLRKTIKSGQLHNLHLHEVAVSDEDGIAHLVAKEEAGHSFVAKAGPGLTVPTTTLDSWRIKQKVSEITAIKIDVEGGELRVLRGAIATLKLDHPIVVCEVEEENLQQMGGSTKEILELLNSAGYHTRWLDGVYSPTIVAQ
jgi:FkbM family methyltransferase